MDTKLVNTKELLSILNISEATLIKLKKEGRIPFFKIGRSFRFKAESVLEALSSEVQN